jgi:hypothetical protein
VPVADPSPRNDDPASAAVDHDEEGTMKYLCLVHHDEKELDALSPIEWNGLIDEVFAFIERFQESGHYVVGHPLEPVQAATTVRVRKGEVSITDGPFAETKEQLGGFFLIEARDLNEAIQVASKFPPGRLGSIEVRPVRELEQMYRGAAAGA